MILLKILEHGKVAYDVATFGDVLNWQMSSTKSDGLKILKYLDVFFFSRKFFLSLSISLHSSSKYLVLKSSLPVILVCDCTQDVTPN